jgi:subtilase family serine protease
MFSMSNNVNSGNTNTENIDVIALKLQYIQNDIKDIKDKLDKDYVTQDQFSPVSKLVYGLVSVALVAVVGAVISVVLK